MTGRKETYWHFRRRTCCVYCGKRIPGAVTSRERRVQHRFTPEELLAARLTCIEHRDLPLIDPAYEYEFERAAAAA